MLFAGTQKLHSLLTWAYRRLKWGESLASLPQFCASSALGQLHTFAYREINHPEDAI